MATANNLDLGPVIGDCGCFQVTIVTVINAAMMSVPTSLLFMAYGLYNPGWICLDDYTSTSINKTTVYPTTTASSDNDFLTNMTTWSKNCTLRKSCQNLLYNPESTTIVTQWDLACDSTWITSIIISIEMSGTLVGSYMNGQIGERFGRKISLYGSVALHGLAQLVASFSISWQMYAACMFFIGVGIGGILTGSYHYSIEFLTAWWRGVFSSIPFWNMGCMLFSLIIFLLKDWQHIHIAGAIMSGLLCLTAIWAPDSVRWLAVNGKVDKAKQIVAKIARMNSRDCPDTQVIDNVAEEEKRHMSGHKYTYMDLFRMKTIRLYSIKLGLIWVVLAITYYGISFGIRSLSGNFYLNFFFYSIIDIPAVLSVGLLVNRFGRRVSTLFYCSLTIAMSLAIVILFFAGSGNARDLAILLLALLCKTSVISFWMSVKIFSSELFPTVVRNLHYGHVNAVARIGGMIAPFMLSDDPDDGYVPFLTIAILNLIMFGIIMTLPETKGKTLQDRIMKQCVDVELQPIQDDEKASLPLE